jgi:hypothetical protein
MRTGPEDATSSRRKSGLYFNLRTCRQKWLKLKLENSIKTFRRRTALALRHRFWREATAIVETGVGGGGRMRKLETLGAEELARARLFVMRFLAVDAAVKSKDRDRAQIPIF